MGIKNERMGIEISRTVKTGGKLEYSLSIVMSDGTRYQRKTSQFLHIVRNSAKSECQMLSIPSLTLETMLNAWERLDNKTTDTQVTDTDKPVI